MNIEELRKKYQIDTDEYLLIKVAEDYCLSCYKELKDMLNLTLYNTVYYPVLITSKYTNEDIIAHEAKDAKQYCDYVNKVPEISTISIDIDCLIILIEMSYLSIDDITESKLKQKIIEIARKKNKKRV